MKLNYSQFCYSGIIKIDNKVVEDDSNELKEATIKLFNYLMDKEGTKEVFTNLIQLYGEYEITDYCEQCGNYDIIVNIEI